MNDINKTKNVFKLKVTFGSKRLGACFHENSTTFGCLKCHLWWERVSIQRSATGGWGLLVGSGLPFASPIPPKLPVAKGRIAGMWLEAVFLGGLTEGQSREKTRAPCWLTSFPGCFRNRPHDRKAWAQNCKRRTNHRGSSFRENPRTERGLQISRTGKKPSESWIAALPKGTECGKPVSRKNTRFVAFPSKV